MINNSSLIFIAFQRYLAKLMRKFTLKS